MCQEEISLDATCLNLWVMEEQVVTCRDYGGVEITYYVEQLTLGRSVVGKPCQEIQKAMEEMYNKGQANSEDFLYHSHPFLVTPT